MTWVKVCGLRDARGIEAAVSAGADAVGFVLVPASPRWVSPEQAAGLAAGMSATAVILTVDLPPDEVLGLAVAIGAGGVQPYGHHAAAVAAAAARQGLLVLRPVSIDGPTSFDHIPTDQLPLADSAGAFENGGAAVHGGTGRVFEWSHLRSSERAFVLAGGLGPDNVGRAVAEVRPYGVDASSRLEASPGVKDPELIRRFVRAAKDQP